MNTGRIICGVAALGMAVALTTARARAQDTAVASTPNVAVTAPSADPAAPVALPDQPAAPSDDTVFAWQEIPANQQVPITRAVFDAGGYELYDTVGETITVPFTGGDLGVMKFARSTTGDMYFVNDGSAPTLYIPDGGYLENAAVPGATWYPFTPDDAPTDPTDVSIAPSYSDFSDMDWYPDMSFVGGFLGSGAAVDASAVVPEPGTSIVVAGNIFYGWAGFRDFCAAHPGRYRSRLMFVRDYRYAAGRRYRSARVFRGASRGFSTPGGGAPGSATGLANPWGSRVFRGARRPSAEGYDVAVRGNVGWDTGRGNYVYGTNAGRSPSPGIDARATLNAVPVSAPRPYAGGWGARPFASVPAPRPMGGGGSVPFGGNRPYGAGPANGGGH